MKRILLIMAIAFISVIANAQDITISGITLGATKNEVIKILNEKKYKYTIEDDLLIIVSEYKNNLSIYINSMYLSFNTDRILKSIALTSSLDNKIFDNYDEIVSKLKEKYGEPSEIKEKYYSPFDEDYKKYPLSALQYIDEHYTTWKVKNLSLTTKVTKFGVLVHYSDTRYHDKETTADY